MLVGNTDGLLAAPNAEGRMLLPDNPDKKCVFCNRCGGETNHILVGEHHRTYLDAEIAELLRWRLWICAGCEQGTLEKSWFVSIVDEDGNPLDWAEADSTYFPPRTQFDVRAKSFVSLPKVLENMYRETLLAFNNGTSVLCAMGIRALIEGICADRGIDGRNLEKKIDGLLSILPANIVSGLQRFRFIGNTAAHQLSPPDIEELRLAIEICEDLLNFLYELNYKARRLMDRPCDRLGRPDSPESAMAAGLQ